MAQIAGLTVEVGADISKFQSSIKQIDGSLRKTRTELSQVNRALKFNPGNTELIKQKQQALKKAIGETKARLTDLKNEYKTMSQQPGFDKNSEDARRLQREIIVTESKLKNLEKQAQQTSSVMGLKMQAAGAKIKSVGDGMQAVGGKLTRGVTMPIVAVGAASVKAFNEVKDGLNIVEQKTGATGGDLEDMQNRARNLAKTIPTDFGSAGTAIGEVNTRFGATGDALEKLSGQYIKFAQVNGVDLTGSIDQTQKALAAFGKGAEDAPHLLDALTRAGQESGASVDTLSAGLIQNATSFQQLGLGIDGSVKLMSQLEKSGANSETVMQGLRKALKNAAKDGKPLDEALVDLQDTIKNGKGDIDGLTAAYDLFGKSGDQIYNAVKNGTIDFEDLAASMDGTEGALNAVFEETLTPAERFKTTLNTLKDAGYEVGNSLMTILQPAMEKVATGAEKLSNWWSSLSKGQQDFILKIGLAAAAAGPLLTVVGKLTSSAGTVIGTVGKIIPMLGGIAAPIGIAVAAIAGLIAVFTTLWRTNDNFRQQVTTAWQSIKSVISTVTGQVKSIISGFVDLVNALWARFGDDIMAGVQAAFGYIAPIVEAALSVVQNVIKTVTAIMRGDWTGAWNGIKAVLSSAWAAMKAVVRAQIAAVKAVVSTGWRVIKSVTSAAWNGIKSAIRAAWNGIKSTVSSAVGNIKSKVSSAWSGIRSKTSSVWNSIKSAITKPIDAAKDKVQGVINKIKSFFPVRMGKILNFSLPVINVSGGKAPWGIGGKGTKPSFSVSWQAHKDQYSNPLLFASPTLIPGADGQNHLLGDKPGAGGELVYGRNALMRDIREATGGGQTITVYMTVNGNDGRKIADDFINELQMRVRMA